MVNLDYFWKKKVILSFIAVILVVIIHNSAISQYSLSPNSIVNFTTFIHNFFAYDLGSIAVPFFFLVAGIAFFRNYKPELYTKKIHSRFKTLFIPFIIWNIIGMLFSIIYTYTPLSQYVTSRELFSPSFQNIFEGIFYYKYNFQFWFLYDLIIYVILTPIFYITLSKKWISIISIIFCLILPLFLDKFLGTNSFFLVFYYLGCFIGKYYLPNFSKPISTKTAFIAFLGFVISLLIKLFSIYNFFQIPTFLSQILIIITLISSWFASDLFIPKLKVKKFTSEFFPIYTLHTYFITVIIKLIYLLMPKNSIMLFINEVFSTIITIIIVTILSYMWHQKLPKLYSFMFGSRK